MMREFHGHAGFNTATYRSWKSMHRRCNNRNVRDYRWYGAVGVKVCKRWNFFSNFLADMGPRPKNKTLDRWPNPSGNYEPSNCRWATVLEQRTNKRRTLTYLNFHKTQAWWCQILGITKSTMTYRVAHWPIEKVLTFPIQKTCEAK